MIEVQGIGKTFGRRTALDSVNMKIKKGSIYGLVGSNGAGKTTLLKILAGVYRADSGAALIDGQPVFEDTAVKSKIMFIPDTIYFFSQYNLREMANFYQGIYQSWNEEHYQSLRQVFGLEEKQKLQHMSKGMQRQAAFWLALSTEPDYLILDEPLDGLDPVMRRKVTNLIFQAAAAREMTVLISSHNLRELEDLCDSVGILHRGQLVLERELDDLKTGLYKIQTAFPGGPREDLFPADVLLHQEQRGSVQLLIVRGQKEAIEADISRHQPLLLDVLPLTLEEIFIYEMGGIGYAIENIILQ